MPNNNYIPAAVYTDATVLLSHRIVHNGNGTHNQYPNTPHFLFKSKTFQTERRRQSKYFLTHLVAIKSKSKQFFLKFFFSKIKKYKNY